jgi:hypothetical protein
MTQPYFYIIQHKETGKKYAGSRWAKGCHPNELMKKGGYCTSSGFIHKLIEQYGLDSFAVVSVTESDDPYALETAFLTENSCADSDEWINRHNNTGMAFGTKEFMEAAKKTCLKKYGVAHNTQMKHVQEQRRKTTLERYGVENAACAESTRIKMKETSLKKYGVDCNLKLPEMKERIRATNLALYGAENLFSTDKFQDKAAKTKLERYGVTNVASLPEIKEKVESTNLKKYGCKAPAQNPKILQKQVDTNISKYGVKYTMQNETVKEKAKRSLLEKYGVDNIAKLPFLSVLKTKRTYPKGIVSTFFPEFKQYY